MFCEPTLVRTYSNRYTLSKSLSRPYLFIVLRIPSEIPSSFHLNNRAMGLFFTLQELSVGSQSMVQYSTRNYMYSKAGVSCLYCTHTYWELHLRYTRVFSNYSIYNLLVCTIYYCSINTLLILTSLCALLWYLRSILFYAQFVSAQ